MTIDESSRTSVDSSPHGHQAGAVSNRRRAAIGTWVRRLLLLTAIGLCIAGNACVRIEDACYNDSSADCAFDMRIEVTDPRFAIEDQSAPPSHDLWIKKDEKLNLSWQEYAVLMQRRGARTCDFNANPFDVENCRRCFFCSGTAADRAKCRGSFSFPTPALPTLLTYENFMSDATPTTARPGDLCRERDGQSHSGLSLQPDSNETLELKAAGTDANPIAAARVFVIAPGASQTVTYQLSPFAAPTPGPSPSPGASPTPTPTVVFYAGSMPRDPIPSDTYSSALHITKVRVLKGKVDVDPNTGKVSLMERDGTAPLPRPSRLVFISGSPALQANGDLDNDGTRCYRFDENVFDLLNCHSDSGNPATALRLEATPDQLGGLSMGPLTWVAEFKVSDGAVIPTLDTDEVMVIEFTIEVRSI